MKTLAEPRDRSAVLDRLETLRADSPRRWGRMTAPQAVCHLSDSFLCVIGRKPVSLRTSLFWRTLGKWGALYLPAPWPRGVPTRPEIDQTRGGTRPAEFAADVAQLAALVELITAESPSFEWQSHPLFGRMSRADWLRWGYLHMDHHLRQFGA